MAIALVATAFAGFNATSAAAAPADAPPRCTITGTSGNDVLRGTPRADVICAGAGDDVVLALGGNDRVEGGPGRDRIYGGAGRDSLAGQQGGDSLVGGPGDDALYGHGGDDRLRGGAGADLLLAAEGDDRIIGAGPEDRVDGGMGDDVGVAQPSAPDCPDTSTSQCWISLHFDTGRCPSFTKSAGNCSGTMYGQARWNDIGRLSWGEMSRIAGNRNVYVGDSAAPGCIHGNIRGPGRAEFYVDGARTKAAGTTNWNAGATEPAGQPSGPLYFNFENGVIGADVYIYGYLQKIGPDDDDWCTVP